MENQQENKPVKKQITGKKIGANLILTLDGAKKIGSRKVTQEEFEAITKKITSYNKKNSDKTYDDIIKMITPVAVAKKAEEAKKKVASKGVKQQIKKASKKKDSIIKEETEVIKDIDLVLELQHKIDTKTVSQDEVKKLEKLLATLKEKATKVEEVKKEVAAPEVHKTGGWGGETYRRN